ncbi:MAG: hypothetical protein Q4G47_06170 [Lachnospiraceae bacterium]|nr:hypothetical protein [Lachnospiraceae bacterium]
MKRFLATIAALALLCAIIFAGAGAFRSGDFLKAVSGMAQEGIERAEIFAINTMLRVSEAGKGGASVSAEASEAINTGYVARDEEEAFSLFGYPVSAAEGLSGFAYDQLSPDVQHVYSQLYTGITDLRSEFTVRAGGSEEIKSAITAIMVDHPEFFWLDGSASMNGFTTFGIWQVKLDFNMDAADIPTVREAIENRALQYELALSPDAGDYEKVKAAYEFIIDITDYVADSPQNQNIQSVFINGMSVCAGYGRALQYLLGRVGVWCAYIEGTTGTEAEGHAWNLVNIDGVYAYVDPSWGDPTYGEDETDAARLAIIYDYLCLTTDEMLRTRHIADGNYELPLASDRTYDYYVMNGMFYDGFDSGDVSSAIWRAVDEGRNSVFFKFSDSYSYYAAKSALFPAAEDGIESLLDAPIRQRMEWDESTSMRYYYSCSDDLWIIKVYW